MYNIWFKPSKTSGLRLSDNGCKFVITTLELAAYEVPFLHTMEMSSNVMIYLSKYMDCPYYISVNSITVYSERKSLELYLFSGDIRRYGLVKAIAAQKKLSNTK